MPNTVFLLDTKPDGLAAELQLPLKELQLAIPEDVTNNTETLVERLGPQLAAYLLAHTKLVSEDGSQWAVTIKDMTVVKAEQTATGPYQELIIHLWLQTPPGQSPRTFTLYYDAIIHQVVTHKILIAVRQDWETGKIEDEQTEVGVISLNTRDNIIEPFKVDLEKGSNWIGFKSMVSLGIQHISEGTDHLLFLLVLLLPAPLVASGKRWAGFGGISYSIIRIIKIATAFTIGHSVTLLFGAIGWVKLPQQPVEMFIAITILVAAIHALRPIFPQKEIFIAGGFGLIHGLAFASVLYNLQLEPGKMALSILGFNIGIELMQLFAIALVMPWLLILSKEYIYKFIRIGGGIFAGIAATAWLMERTFNQPNLVTNYLNTINEYSIFIIIGLIITVVAVRMIRYLNLRKVSAV